MRIIKEGRIPDIAVIFTCEVCGTVYEVTYRELLERNGDINVCSCPNCDFLNCSEEKRTLNEQEIANEMALE